MKVCPVFLNPTEFIVSLAWSEIYNVWVSKSHPNVCLFICFSHRSLSLPCLLLSLSQPKGRAGGRVCCFSAGDEMRRTVTRGACLSDIHPLTLPPTHWRSDTHAPCHINTYWQEKKDTHRHTHTAKWQQTHTKLRLKISFLKIKTQLEPKHKKEKKKCVWCWKKSRRVYESPCCCYYCCPVWGSVQDVSWF